MERIARWFKVPKHRKYIYRTATAGLALAGTYGLIGPDEVAAWSAFLGIALVTALADGNTSRDGVPDGDGVHRADPTGG